MGTTSVKGKTIYIGFPSYQLYTAFSNMNNLVRNLPEEKRRDLKVTEDTIEGNLHGISMGLKIIERRPFSSVTFEQYGNSPFKFNITMFFDAVDLQKTNFHIELTAELNFLMSSMIGGKLQELVDQITDQLASAFEGKIPEEMQPDITKYN